MIPNYIIFGIKLFLLTHGFYACSMIDELYTLANRLKQLGQGLVSLAPRRLPALKLQKMASPNIEVSKSLEAQRELFNPFDRVMGMNELALKNVYRTNKNMFASLIDRETHELINLRDNKKFKAGNFEQLNIGRLRQDFQQYVKTNPGTGSRFSVIEAADRPYNDGTGKPNWFRSLVDIGALQADQSNRGALFQVASNFNALEAGGDPWQGIAPYMTSGYYVQGEAAALSAIPGTILRNYFVRHQKNGRIFFGQLEEQLNFLQNIPEIPLRNGYPGIFDPKQFQQLSQQGRMNVTGKVDIGFHDGIQVTSGFGPEKKYEDLHDSQMRAIKVDNPDQTIAQLFTAALNITGAHEDFEAIAQIILDAAYEGTLKTALIKGKTKVFLTLIGGGVFNNKLAWIQAALVKALQAVLPFGNMDITLIVYDTSNFKTAEVEALRKVLLPLVSKSGGKYEVLKTDGIYQIKYE